MIRFKNGVIGTLAAGWVDVDDPVQLLISGTEAHAVIVKNELYYKNAKVPGADGKQPYATLPDALPLPLNQFVDAVAGKPGQPLVSPGEAAARVTVMEAMYQAARGHKWVKVTGQRL
jgi:predicted dehydrogenase